MITNRILLMVCFVAFLFPISNTSCTEGTPTSEYQTVSKPTPNFSNYQVIETIKAQDNTLDYNRYPHYDHGNPHFYQIDWNAYYYYGDNEFWWEVWKNHWETDSGGNRLAMNVNPDKWIFRENTGEIRYISNRYVKISDYESLKYAWELSKPK